MTRFGTGVQDAATVLCSAQPAAYLAGELAADHFYESGVFALAHGGVEIDKLHEWVSGETVDPVLEVVESELEGFALNELNDATAHEID